MIFSHIIAMSRNRVIGKDGKLPWSLPEDMKFFRKTTNGRVMIMGRKTFESLPGHLPNRHHIVISHNAFVSDEADVTFVRSVDEAVAAAKKLTGKYGDEIFIIGGGEICRQTMDLVDKIYLTVIDQDFEGDAFYPEIPESKFLLVDQNDRPGPPPFSFRTYLRKQ